ncbi:MAG: helix-turn-helix domain-containing protein [Niabella sp.]|nr:helix-turn-helix domain-containing protein [Niabella sp.]
MESKPTVAKLPDDQVGYKQIKGIEDYNKTVKCTYFLIVLFEEGSGIHYIDDAEFPIRKNQLHFLFPGQHHHWETGPETFAHKIVVGKKIYESFSDTDEFLFIRNNLNPVLKLSDTVFSVVDSEISCIKTELESLISGDKEWIKIIQLRMDILAAIMRREAEGYLTDHIFPRLDPVIKQFSNLVRQHYSEEKFPSWYARQLSISSNYLNILCQKNLKVTATEMIHLKIMQEAKRLLRFSKRGVKEISFDLGFENLSGFSAFFKKKSGFTPTEYRDT